MMDKYILSLLLTVVIGPLISGVVVFWWQSRVRAKERTEVAPLEMYQAALQSSQREMSANREQLVLFMKDHMKEDKEERERDRTERDQLVEVLTKTAEAIRAVKDELVEHRAEERDRTASLHVRLDEIKTEVLRRGNV